MTHLQRTPLHEPVRDPSMEWPGTVGATGSLNSLSRAPAMPVDRMLIIEPREQPSVNLRAQYAQRITAILQHPNLLPERQRRLTEELNNRYEALVPLGDSMDRDIGSKFETICFCQFACKI